MNVYSISEMTVQDASWVKDYVTSVTALIEQRGGRILARTPAVERLEGERTPPEYVVLVEWPSREAAVAFYNSSAYRPYRERRLAGAENQMLLLAAEDIARTGPGPVGRSDNTGRAAELPLQVTTFIESYRAAFGRLDAEAIAGLFTYPLLITGDAERITPASIGSREEWIGHLRRLLQTYCALGFASADPLAIGVVALSPRLFQAAVDWQLRDGAGAPLYDFNAVYTLAEVAGDLRITAIAHNERTQSRDR